MTCCKCCKAGCLLPHCACVKTGRGYADCVPKRLGNGHNTIVTTNGNAASDQRPSLMSVTTDPTTCIVPTAVPTIASSADLTPSSIRPTSISSDSPRNYSMCGGVEQCRSFIQCQGLGREQFHLECTDTVSPAYSMAPDWRCIQCHIQGPAQVKVL